MADPTADTQPSIARLVAGIANDTYALVRQQMSLFRLELHEDMETARRAVMEFAAAMAILFIGAFMIGIMAAHVLQTVAPSIPLWGCFGIVGLVSLAAGVVVLNMANRKFRSIAPVADQTTAAAKENIQWLASPK